MTNEVGEQRKSIVPESKFQGGQNDCLSHILLAIRATPTCSEPPLCWP